MLTLINFTKQIIKRNKLLYFPYLLFARLLVVSFMAIVFLIILSIK